MVVLGWDQAPLYNANCPFNNQYNARTVTGCVATAMAMIMKYWNYPAQGSGNWQLLQPGTNISNPVPIKINGPYNYIQLYSAMTLTPAQFVSGQTSFCERKSR